MLNKNRTKFISVILAMLAMASLVCASAFSAVAQEIHSLSYGEIISQMSDEVSASGIVEEGALKEGENIASTLTYENSVESLMSTINNKNNEFDCVLVLGAGDLGDKLKRKYNNA